MKQTRRQQLLIKQNQRNLKWVAGGVIIIVIFLVFFGAKLLVGFSLFVQKGDGDTTNSNDATQELLAPPSIDDVPTATNTASVVYSGSADGGDDVVIYVNGSKVKTVPIEKDRSFSTKISLEKGDNEIKSKVKTSSNHESNFSDSTTTVYDTTAPSLSIDFPTNGETYHKDNNPLKIKGKTDSDSTVTINGSHAIVGNDGSYLYSLSLQNGENTIAVESIDDAGNSSKSEVKVNYSE